MTPLLTFNVSMVPLPMPNVKVGAVPEATLATNPAVAKDEFWFKSNVPMVLSAMLKLLPAFNVSDAPRPAVAVVPALTVPECGFTWKVAPLLTLMAVFPRLPVPLLPKASVPLETVVAPG